VAEYEFLTAWLLAAPIDRVWDALYEVEAWPSWWRGVTRTHETHEGGPDGVGKRFTIAWRSLLPYDLEFETTVVALDRPHVMEGHAVGELTGTGRWRLYERDEATAVLYEWNVRTTKRWMNAIAPIARPIFAWNHDYVMRRGGEGIARHLGVELLAAS
jgi:hypothetical protein